MRTAKFLRIYLFALFLIPALLSTPFSEASDSILGAFLQHAKAKIVSKEYMEAITDYYNVLLLEPTNPDAKSGLEILSGTDDLPIKPKMNLLMVLGLLNANEQIQKEIVQFGEKNIKLASSTKTQPKELMLQPGLNLISRNGARGVPFFSTDELTRSVIETLTEIGEGLRGELASEKKKYFEFVHSTVQGGRENAGVNRSSDSVVPNASLAARQDEWRSPASIGTKPRDASGLVELSLKYVELESVLSKKNVEIQEYRKQLEDVASRWQLSKKIIREKEAQLDALRDSTSIRPETLLDNSRFSELYSKLHSYQLSLSSLTDLLDEKDHAISDLQAEVEQLKKDSKRVNANLEQKDRSLAALQKEFQQSRLRFQERTLTYMQDLQEKELQIQQSRDMIALYRQKLKGAKDVHDETALNAAGLKSMLYEMHSKLSTKQQSFEILSAKLRDLEVRLTAVQQRLFEFDENVPYEQIDFVKKDIKDLMDEFNQIDRRLKYEIADLPVTH